MNTELLKAYREARKPYFPQSYPGKLCPTAARIALRQARYRIQAEKRKAVFEALGGVYIGEYDASDDGDLGAMRIVEHADGGLTLEDLEGDTFNPEACPGINPNVLKREQAEFHDRVRRDGVWGYVAEVFDGEDWQHADSVWGFVGDDFNGSGYDADLREACLSMRERFVTQAARELEETRPDMYARA
jgi:hypothetical protein